MMRVRKITVGSLLTNCYLVADEEAAQGILIDPGAEAQKILLAVKEARFAISHLLLTHAHPDHFGAAAELKRELGAAVAVHAKDCSFLPSGVVRADIEIFEGWTLAVGDFTLETLHTPGHTPGSVCYYFAEEGILFSGDTLFVEGVGRTDLPGGNQKALLSSLRRLSKLPPKTLVYPGHGPSAFLKIASQGPKVG